MQKALVIGGHGFMGGAIARRLRDIGRQVKVVDKRVASSNLSELFDISTYPDSELDKLIEGHDAVYLMNGMLGTSELRNNIAAAVRENVLNTCRVIESCIRMETPHVFYASKPKVWPDVYTITKTVNDDLIRVYNEHHPVKVTCLRCYSSYGPGQSIHPVRKMLPVFVALGLRNKPITIFGNGDQVVDMMYVDDMARVIIDATEDGLTVQCDLGTGEPIPVRQVAEDVIRLTGSTGGLVKMPMRPGETGKSEAVADTSLLRSLFGHLTSWEEGLRKTVQYYRENPEMVDRALDYYKP